METDDKDREQFIPSPKPHGCHNCRSKKMYGCTQGREAYPNGGADACPPRKKSPGWMTNLR